MILQTSLFKSMLSRSGIKFLSKSAIMSPHKLKLYVSNVCPYCQKAEIVARERKVSYDREIIDIHGTVPDWYKKINPDEAVPSLVVNEKKIILESNLITQYIDHCASSKSDLFGIDPLERQRIELFMSQVGEFVGAARAALQDPLNQEKRDVMEERIKYVESVFASSQLGGPFMMGDRFTYGDICVLPFLHQMKGTLAYYIGYNVFAHAPALKAMYAAAIQRKSVKLTLPKHEDSIAGMSYLIPDSCPMKGAQGGYALLNGKLTPFGDRVKIAANIKGFKYHSVEVSLPVPEHWLTFYNPRGTVPTLISPSGEAIHESMNILQYIDEVQGMNGRTLIPRDSADRQYDVQYFIAQADNLEWAMREMMKPGKSEDKEAGLKWAAGKIEELLTSEGPFHGGKQMDAGDIALLPFFVQMNAMPEGIVPFNYFEAYPKQGALLKAGLEAPECQGVFLTSEEYAAAYQKHMEGAKK